MSLKNLSPFPQSTNQKAESLEQCGWLREADWAQIEAFSKYLEAYRAAKGSLVVEEGEREAFMGILTKGGLEVLKDDGSGTLKVLARLGSGRAFGEMSLLDGSPRSATLRGMNDVSMLILSKTNFQRLCDEKPALAVLFLHKMCRLLSERLRMTSGKLSEFLTE